MKNSRPVKWCLIGFALGFALASFAINAWPADTWIPKISFMFTCGVAIGCLGFIAPYVWRVLGSR